MSNTEQITILAIVAWVSYLVGQAKANKDAGACTCKGTTTGTSAEASEGTASMDWFANWSGLK